MYQRLIQSIESHPVHLTGNSNFKKKENLLDWNGVLRFGFVLSGHSTLFSVKCMFEEAHII